MYDYISQIYHGEPIYLHTPGPLDNKSSTLSRQIQRVRSEMGEPFAQALACTLRMELNSGRADAFRDGVQLGGQLMLSLLGNHN